MPDVVIVVEPAAVEPISGVLTPAVAQMVLALKQAILSDQANQGLQSYSSIETAPVKAAFESVRVVTTLSLTQNRPDSIESDGIESGDLICPLALDLPELLGFPAATLYRACWDVLNLRQQVEAWQYPIGDGGFWLPIVLTAKGPLFAEAIGGRDLGIPSQDGKDSLQPHSIRSHYIQPVHLSDRHRQTLYRLGYLLLQSLCALPAVYLLQFGLQDGEVCFDRLLPFPGQPAIASLDIQLPDLFACHWRCISGKTIRDLIIQASAEYPE